MFDSQIFFSTSKEFLYLLGELLILFVGISFLVALLQIYISPVLNPVIITLFIAFFGIKATLVYVAFTFLLAVTMGILLDKLGFVKEVKESAQGSCGCSGGTTWETLSGSFFDKQRQAIVLAAN